MFLRIDVRSRKTSAKPFVAFDQFLKNLTSGRNELLHQLSKIHEIDRIIKVKRFDE